MRSTRRDMLQRIARSVEPLYGVREAGQIARIAVTALGGITLTQLLAEPDEPLEIEGLDEAIAQLAAGRPVQYVVGHTQFCGLRIAVREGVLIPRPETEELVEWLLHDPQQPASLLDLCTGSGCIALAFKSRRPAASATGVDLSARALDVARENARRLALEVEWLQGDVLEGLPHLQGRSFAAIVANPPYIPASERSQMRPNVADFEPSEALFVPDRDPLCFYRAIVRSARRLLEPQGSLWFELHEKLAGELTELLRSEGCTRIEIRRDMNDKPRMACCRPD